MKVSKSPLGRTSHVLAFAALISVCPMNGVANGQGAMEPTQAPTTNCPADANDRSICGVSRPEDMAPLARSEWVIVSGFASDALYRVSTRTRHAKNLVPGARAKWDKKAYPGCPGPLTSGGLTAHGIAVANGSSPILFVINHGSREAIEVYRIDRKDAALTWTGCVPIPSDMMANSIVQLKSGVLVVTSLGTPKTNFLPDIVAGRITGNVRLWARNGGWRTLPHSEGSGPNGLALAPDGRSIYVAMSGSREIVHMALDGKSPPRRSLQIAILPDNLRWTPEGKLITTGMSYDPDVNARCFQGLSCQPRFDVYEIAPATMTVKSLADRFESRPMPLTTTALRVGSDLWVSSVSGENIAVFPLKPE